MLAAEGAFEPFFVGLLCDERIIANPFLALDSEKLADFMLSDNYVDEVTAWGNTQLRFLYSFVPSKRVEGGTQFKSIVRLKPWNTSIYEALPVCENYEAELAEEAQLMSSLFNYASSQH